MYDVAGAAVVSRGACPLALTQDRPGQAEQDPQAWTEGLVRASAAALESVDRAAVVAVSVSGQQHGLVPLDAEFGVLMPAKLWCDTESAEEAAELSRQMPFAIGASFTLSKLLWMKRHRPDLFARLAHVALPHDYMNYWLTGLLVSEASDASGIGCLDIVSRNWDVSLASLVDDKVAECLPALVGPDEAVGTLTAAAAERLGLETDVVVAPGGGDNAMSALGAGAVVDGQAVMSLGTSGTLFCRSSAPVADPTGTVAPFCDATGGYLPLLCTLNCTSATEEVRKAFGMDLDTLTDLAAREPPGAHGVNFVPYLMGERTPNLPQATGALLGLRPGLMRPGVVFRAALEGATYSLLAGSGALEDQGARITELRVVGGGSKNKLWRKMIADSFQVPVLQLQESETAALGAALQAAAVWKGEKVGDYVRQQPPPLEPGATEPDPGAAGAYVAAFQRHVELGGKLFQ